MLGLFWRLSGLALQETRWQLSSCWQSGAFSVIRSGENKGRQSYGGVLVAVKSPSLRCEEIVSGRLLRVQALLPMPGLPLEWELVCFLVSPDPEIGAGSHSC